MANEGGLPKQDDVNGVRMINLCAPANSADAHRAACAEISYRHPASRATPVTALR
jgi:hypothetical protein